MDWDCVIEAVLRLIRVSWSGFEAGCFKVLYLYLHLHLHTYFLTTSTSIPQVGLQCIASSINSLALM